MNALFDTAILVEDEPNLASTIKIALKRLGIIPKHATTIREARDHILKAMPEFVLLDRFLPDGDGLNLCEELRKKGFAGVILMLTAAGQTSDRVQGLNAGADDYLPKPFAWEEFEARIRALSRRKPQVAPQTQANAANEEPGLWHQDEARLRIQGPLGWVELTPLEYKLATHLMSAQGAIVNRDDLLKHVWGFTLLPKTRTVDHFMSRLRKHFERNPEEPEHFLTVRGAGYRFQA